jgi:cytochrome c-type biogenesis protein CcmH/NrfF
MLKGRGVRRAISALAVCLLTVMMLGADDAGSRFNRIGHQMMCVCGCGQILLECNHVGCPDSDRMIGELREQLRAGNADTAIMNWFAAKYGPTVLAAPIRGGFDNVAWIAPLAAFLLATIGTGVLVVYWRRRTAKQVPAGGGFVAGDELREKIRRETEY